MTRYFKVAFCLFVLFGAAALAGCSETDKAKPADKPAAADASKPAADTADDKK